MYRFGAGADDEADRFAVDTVRAIECDIATLEYGNIGVGDCCRKLNCFRFTGNRRRFEFQLTTVENACVGRHFIAVLDVNDIADDEIYRRYLLLFAVTDDGAAFRQQIFESSHRL